jgi:hypothetical protein
VERAGRGRGLEQRRWLRGGGEEDGGLGGHGGGRLVGGEEELLGAGLVVVTGDKVGSGRAALLYCTNQVEALAWPLRPTQATCGSSLALVVPCHSASPEASLFLFFSVGVFRFPCDCVILDGTFARSLHVVVKERLYRCCSYDDHKFCGGDIFDILHTWCLKLSCSSFFRPFSR